MNDRMEDLRGDIAYMRDLAEAGASTPLLGGQIAILNGGIFGTVAAVHWAMAYFGDPEGWMYSALWLGASAFAMLMMVGVIKRMKGQPGAQSPANRASGQAWNAVGWSIGVVLASAYIIAWRTGSSAIFAIIPCIIVTVYGAAWLVAANVSRQKWMGWVAVASFAFGPVSAFFITSPYLFLIFAAGMYLVGLIPGIIMVRREPSLIV